MFMKMNISLPSALLGIVIGVWLTTFFVFYTVRQEFSGLETAGNADYVQLKNELLDDAVLVPLATAVPLTIGVGVTMAAIGWSKSKPIKTT